MKHKTLIITTLVLAALLFGVMGAAAQTGDEPPVVEGALGTGFTYQGYLAESDDTPINDSCDMEIGLWDAATGGSLIGGTMQISNFQVDHGYFTLTLNGANEFGATPFNGDARYLQFEIWCDSYNNGQGVTLSRQAITAAPYAHTALNVLNLPDHDHVAETWINTASAPTLSLENSHTSGTALYLDAMATGSALQAHGPVYISGKLEVSGKFEVGDTVYVGADSILNLSPFTAMSRAVPAEVTIYPLANGGVSVNPTSTVVKERLLVIPVSTYRQLFGSDVYIKGLRICYKINSAGSQYIDAVGVYKGSDDGASYEAYLTNNTDRASTTRSCFAIFPATPRVAITNASYVQIHLNADGPITTSDGFMFYSIDLFLTEDAE